MRPSLLRSLGLGLCYWASAAVPTIGANVGDVHVVTVASDATDASALLQSAKLANIDIQVLGVGIAMPWPTGLRTKIMLVKEFVAGAEIPDDDLIVFVDAWDTMVMTQSAETMRTGFQKVEEMVKRPIIFAPEEYCFPQDSETKDTLCAYFDKVAPPADVPTDRKAKRRYLNSGLFAGRHRDLKTLFTAPIPDDLPLSDQPWYQLQFRETELIGLDYEQAFFAAHPFGTMMWQHDPTSGRAFVSDVTSGSRPAVVHWNGPAHWCKTAGGGFSYNFINGYQRAAIKVVGWYHAPLHCDALQISELILCWGGSVLSVGYLAIESGGAVSGIRRKINGPLRSNRRRMMFAIALLVLGFIGFLKVIPYYTEYHIVNAIDMRDHVTGVTAFVVCVYFMTAYLAWQGGGKWSTGNRARAAAGIGISGSFPRP